MSVLTVTDRTWPSLLASTGPLLVFFSADWCPACRSFAPTLEALARQYADRAIVAKADCQECRDLCRECRVSSIPQVVLFDRGQVHVRYRPGAVPFHRLCSDLDQLLAPNTQPMSDLDLEQIGAGAGRLSAAHDTPADLSSLVQSEVK